MKKLLFVAISVLASNFAFSQNIPSGPENLRCEYLDNPLGIDSSNPRLTWMINDPQTGARQTAWQIITGTDSVAVAGGKGNYWDSGKITSDRILAHYDGTLLIPFTKYYWKVIAWNKDNQPASSSVASFETGMMDQKNWKGAWISDRKSINFRPAPYFRKVFEAKKTIRSARAYIAAGGLYELYINGKKAGDHRLDPMYTRYDRRNLYVTYDVTAQLQKGENAIGVLLGNGWYNHQAMAVWNFDQAPWRARPTFCLDLKITYDDGSTETISSERDWKTSSGPVISNNIYTAEHYDARLDQPGWNTVNFDDSKWDHIIYRSAPSPNVTAQQMHPIRNVEAIPTKNIKQINDTTYVFDLGRNIAGVTRIRVKGESGTIIRIKHGERIYTDGRVDLSNIDVYYRPQDDTDPFQTDIFILSGQGEEEFMPKFNYKGFQYIEVTSNKPVQLNKESLTGYFMHSDVPSIGKLTTSDPFVNKLWEATNNAYLSNLYGYPTDCPQREKNGWTGDGHFAIETALYNFDGISVYEKWLADHRDEQQPNGVLPDIIPTGGWGYGTDNGVDWTSTIAIIPWNIYLFYGDIQLLSNCYDNIKRYVDYIDRNSPSGLTSWARGDWVPVRSHSSKELTSSVYFYVDASILATAAGLLGREEDRKYYGLLAEKIKNAVNDKYLNKQTGIYSNGTQTELSVPLQWGIVPDEYKAIVAKNLAQNVIEANHHLDVGVLGAKAVLNALSENGQGEVAYRLASQNTYPSWGWWIANGATTLYENWDLQAERDISQNHMMFGEIGAWLFKALGGIKPDPENPGFKNILLKPVFTSKLSNSKTEFRSPYGKIISDWTRKGKNVQYQITIPANSSADFFLPENASLDKIIDITENKTISLQAGKENEYHLLAGSYRIELKMKK